VEEKRGIKSLTPPFPFVKDPEGQALESVAQAAITSAKGHEVNNLGEVKENGL
jgi:hypothetical protein